MKNRNRRMYFATVIIIILVYLVIYLFGSGIKLDDDGYQQNVPKQPINDILSAHNNDEEKNEKNILFRYESDTGNYIELYNQFPTTDEVGMAFSGNKYTQDFKLKLNSYARGVKYTITLKKQSDTNMEDDWAKVYLEADGLGVSNCFRDSGRIKTFNEYPIYSGNSEEIILYEGTISYAEAERGYKNFTLRMWVSEDVEVNNAEYFGKSFKTKVTVYAVKK